jgi:predicted metal-dependent phosphoesterase TrpH
MLVAGKRAGVEVIPGVEITCRVIDQEVHMLGYFFGDTWQDASLRNVLEHSRRLRTRRIEQFVKKFNELGVPLTVAEVEACSECGSIGRPHVALALVRRKIVKNVDEAFERFLKRGKPAFVDRPRMTAAEAIGQIRRAGGVAVLAHPGLNRVDDRLRDMIAQGLEGIEVWHPRHSAAQSKHYLKLSEQLGLLATGGSDCHGNVRGGELIGSVKLPLERVEALRERALVATR